MKFADLTETIKQRYRHKTNIDDVVKTLKNNKGINPMPAENSSSLIDDADMIAITRLLTYYGYGNVANQLNDVAYWHLSRLRFPTSFIKHNSPMTMLDYQICVTRNNNKYPSIQITPPQTYQICVTPSIQITPPQTFTNPYRHIFNNVGVRSEVFFPTITDAVEFRLKHNDLYVFYEKDQ